MRYFIYFSYNGAAYHGWQYQPNAISVQEKLESAFQALLRQRVILTAAGRTDTGVHARLMVAHFDLPENSSPKVGEVAPLVTEGYDRDFPSSLAFRLNGLLPDDISVHKIVPVRPDAHARFDATSRTYEYWVTSEKNPYTTHLLTYTRFQLDYERMNEAAKILLETKDFASFCKAHSDNKTTLCDVRRAFWEERPMPLMPELTCHVFTIEADRFLRNMVRAVVGTLFEVGRGAMSIDQMRHTIEARNRCAAGQSMPPDGLYLTHITYPNHLFLE